MMVGSITIRPDETERQSAVRYGKRMTEITADLECPLMNSEFNGRPERAAEREAAFWRSLAELRGEHYARWLTSVPDTACP